ncbi:hypothetical protein K0A97_02430 [Patescibacteria group bacterium]|nr:hypothetical protein [Patescibacteria group bacterium]
MLNLKRFFKIKRDGQTGETLTWFIATVIIISILLIFIFISNAGGYIQDFMGKELDYSVMSKVRLMDTPNSKSFYAYTLTKDPEGKKIFKELSDSKNFNEFTGSLAKEIFNETLIGENYPYTWAGIFSRNAYPNSLKANAFFGVLSNSDSNKCDRDSIYLSNGVYFVRVFCS